MAFSLFRKRSAAAVLGPEPAPATTPSSAEVVSPPSAALDDLRTAATAAEQDAEAASTASSMAIANVQMVAGMMGEMTSRMQEVKDKVGSARDFVERGASQSRRTTECIARLSKSVEQIAATIASIRDIASMTNILALNAAIEAARAGEAGAGFAVVANEVKALATNTARLVAEIGREIEAIRSADQEVEQGVVVVDSAFAHFASLFGELTAAVDEQNGSLGTVASFAREAGESVQGLTDRLDHIAGLAKQMVGRCRPTESQRPASDEATDPHP